MQLDDVKISCLVCTLEGPPSLDQLIDSLAVQGWVTGDELLVVIDKDVPAERRADIEARVQQFADAGIGAKCILVPQHGLVHARNQAILASTNRWLFTLDDDDLVDAEALRQIRRRLAKHPAIGGLCPRIEAIWPSPPKPWAVVLGHQVLGYNSSELYEAPYAWQLWEPGVIGRRPPTGGMLIARSVALEFVQLCNDTRIIQTLAPQDGRPMAGADFILYSLLYRNKELVTAYDDIVIVRRQIPESAATFGQLCKAMFWRHYSFGMIDLMRFGKMRVLDVLIRGNGRLMHDFALQSKKVASMKIMLGYSAGGIGYICGTLAGLFNGDCERIHINP